MERSRIIETLGAEGGQIAAYLLNIAIVFIILVLLLTQAVPIIINHFTIGNIANSAATEAVKTLQTQRNNDLAALTKTVQDYLSERGAKLAGPIEVGATEIKVPVKKIRETFLFSNVSFLCQYVEADAVGVDTK